MDNKHYLKIAVGRELTAHEFEELTDIIEEEIGEYVTSDDVIEGKEDGMMCYFFEISEPIPEDATSIELLTYEIDQIIPSKIEWTIESF
jgi:hypothetical protein